MNRVIQFSREMAIAILELRKGQTRRPVQAHHRYAVVESVRVISVKQEPKPNRKPPVVYAVGDLCGVKFKRNGAAVWFKQSETGVYEWLEPGTAWRKQHKLTHPYDFLEWAWSNGWHRFEFVITGIHRESLSVMDDRHARLEGFSDLKAYRDYWRSLYGAKTDFNAQTWVLSICPARLQIGGKEPVSMDTLIAIPAPPKQAIAKITNIA